jgi:hypothetical protein
MPGMQQVGDHQVGPARGELAQPFLSRAGKHGLHPLNSFSISLQSPRAKSRSSSTMTIRPLLVVGRRSRLSAHRPPCLVPLGRTGKRSSKHAPPSRPVERLDPSPKILHEAVDHGQTKPGPFADLFGGKERVEDAGQDLGRSRCRCRSR